MSAWAQHPRTMLGKARRTRRYCDRRPSCGFTLVELVVILIVVGILAVAAIPRFFDNAFSERGFHDGVKAAIQHARKVAVASRRYVCVTVAANGVTLTLDPTLPEANAAAVACGAALNLPVPQPNCLANQVCAPAGVALAVVAPGLANFNFDPLGRPVGANKAVLAAATTITVTNQPNIVVQPDSGWVQ